MEIQTKVHRESSFNYLNFEAPISCFAPFLAFDVPVAISDSARSKTSLDARRELRPLDRKCRLRR